MLRLFLARSHATNISIIHPSTSKPSFQNEGSFSTSLYPQVLSPILAHDHRHACRWDLQFRTIRNNFYSRLQNPKLLPSQFRPLNINSYIIKRGVSVQIDKGEMLKIYEQRDKRKKKCREKLESTWIEVRINQHREINKRNCRSKKISADNHLVCCSFFLIVP